MIRNLMSATVMICICLLFSCQKDLSKKQDQNGQSANIPKVSRLQTLINNAKQYFEGTVIMSNIHFNTSSGQTPNERQLLKKTPRWDKAYVTTTDEGFEIVIVPLKFEKNMSAKPSFAPGKSMPIEKQSYLYVYKGSLGYQAELVTTIPDTKHLESRNSEFSGVIIVEDWAGNNLHSYLLKDGKTYVNAQPSNHRPTTYCYVIDWYKCDLDENDEPISCMYYSTEYLGCFTEELHDRLWNEVGGGGYSADGQIIKRPWTWTIHTTAYWRAESTEEVSGIKDPADAPSNGHYVGNSHQTSYLAIGMTEFTYQELSNTNNYYTYSVNAYTNGKVTDNYTTLFATYYGYDAANFNTLFP